MARFGEQHTTEAEQEKSAHVSNLQTHTEPHLKNNLACVLGGGRRVCAIFTFALFQHARRATSTPFRFTEAAQF